jgi:hypothetical protein
LRRPATEAFAAGSPVLRSARDGTAWTITIDCADPAVQAAFWCQALGYVDGAPPAGSASWEEYLASVGVPGSPGRPGGWRPPRAAGGALGAGACGGPAPDAGGQDGVPDHFVMADTEDNEFCVV